MPIYFLVSSSHFLVDQLLMASSFPLPSLALTLFTILLFSASPSIINKVSAQTTMEPLACSTQINTCDALLHHNISSLSRKRIALFYSVNVPKVTPISTGNKRDFLVRVPCSCSDVLVNGTQKVSGYFYSTNYTVRPKNTFYDVSNRIYSGQALQVGREEETYTAGKVVPMHLLCGCVGNRTQIVVTYTVRAGEFLTKIGEKLFANIDGIMGLNPIQDVNSIKEGQVLFVPSEKRKLLHKEKG